MIRRSLDLTARLAGWALASLVVLGAVALWLFATGPLPLDVLTPHLERALSSRANGLTTTIETTELRVGRREGVALVALGVITRNPRGEVLFDLPEVEVALSTSALIQHRILAPSRLRARSPRVVLTREADGNIGLRESVAQDRTSEPVDLALLAGVVLSKPHPDLPLSFLELVGIDGASVTLEDEASGTRIDASGGTLSVVREGNALAARAAVAIEREGRTLGATALLRLDPERDEVDVRVDLERARPVDLRLVQDLAPPSLAGTLGNVPLETIDVGLSTRLRATADFAGTLHALDFRVTSRGGRITWPEELERPVDLAHLQLTGAFAPDTGRLSLERLDLLANGAGLAASGDGWLTPDGPRIHGEAWLRDVSIDQLDALWPLRTADEARAWVMENISAGEAPQGEVVIDIQPGDLAQKPLRKEAVTGSFAFEDLTVRYFEPLPVVEGVDGTATFDAQSMRFAAGDGALGALSADDASITVTGIGIKGRDTTQLEVQTTIEGPLGDALALIDLPPFGFASELGIDSRRARGAMRTVLRVGLPLHRELSDDEVRIDAEATLAEVGLDGLFDLVDLADGTFELDVSREAMSLGGRALLAGSPVDVAWEEVFSSGPAERRLSLSAMIDPAALRALGVPELPIEFDGAARTRLNVVEDRGRLAIDADLDLATSRLAYAPLDWRKPIGEAARLEARLEVDDGTVSVERFEFTSEELAAAASARLGLVPLTLQEATVRRFEHRGQLLSGTARRDPDGRLEIALDARRLDLRRFLAGDEDEADDTDAAAPARRPPLRLDISAREVVLGDDGTLRDLTGVAERGRRGWRSGELSALLPNGRPVRVRLRPDGERRTLVVRSDDAGALFSALDHTHQIEGGRFLLEADIEAQEPELVATGRLMVDDFVLRDAPVLARLFTVASFTGINNLLAGEGIFVDRLELPFTLEGDVLTLRGGRLTGSQLGLVADGTLDLDSERLDLAGTIVPVYGLNRAIGAIPVIGDFLAGSEGEGAFAASYRVRGPFGEPSVSVNPLSAITPGFLRDLVAAIRDGTLEPPDLPEDRTN